MACLIHAKTYIKEGLLDKISLQQSMAEWKNSTLSAITENKTIGEYILGTENGRDIMEKIDDIVKENEKDYWFKPLR